MAQATPKTLPKNFFGEDLRFRFFIRTKYATYEQDRLNHSFAEAIADINPLELTADDFVSREDLLEGGLISLTTRELAEEIDKAEQIKWEMAH